MTCLKVLDHPVASEKADRAQNRPILWPCLSDKLCIGGRVSCSCLCIEAVWFERDAAGSSLVRVRPPFIPATENEPAAHRAATKAFAVANRNVSGMAGFGDNVDHTSETTLYRCAYLFQSVGPLGQQLGLNLESSYSLVVQHAALTADTLSATTSSQDR